MPYALRKKTAIVSGLLIAYSLWLMPSKMYADTSEDNNYIFHMNVNTDTDQGDQIFNQPVKKILQTPTPLPIVQKLRPTPTAIPKPETNIQTGYTDKEPVTDFSFTLSDNIVNYGPLSPGDIITRENTLTVSGDPTYRYALLASEDHELKDEKNLFIPNTTCDDGKCTNTNASEWTNSLTYGFGYRCDNNRGQDCDENFSDDQTYMQFSDASISNENTALAYGVTDKKKELKITYKLNIAGTQQPGYYSNTITYIAMPMY